jgi:hypothetical protein
MHGYWPPLTCCENVVSLVSMLGRFCYRLRAVMVPVVFAIPMRVVAPTAMQHSLTEPPFKCTVNLLQASAVVVMKVPVTLVMAFPI